MKQYLAPIWKLINEHHTYLESKWYYGQTLFKKELDILKNFFEVQRSSHWLEKFPIIVLWHILKLLVYQVRAIKFFLLKRMFPLQFVGVA